MSNRIYFLAAIMCFGVILLFIQGNGPMIGASGQLIGSENSTAGMSITEKSDGSEASILIKTHDYNSNPNINSKEQESNPFIESIFKGESKGKIGTHMPGKSDTDYLGQSQESSTSTSSGYYHKSKLMPSYNPNLAPSLGAASAKINELWIQGQSKTSQYAIVPVGDNVQLIVDPCAQGIADVYQLDLNENALIKYRTEVSMGLNTVDLIIQQPGRYILIYVLNDQPSNAVIIDASSGSYPLNNRKNPITLGAKDNYIN
jgi:hypothetical protein